VQVRLLMVYLQLALTAAVAPLLGSQQQQQEQRRLPLLG
jgi:hypothetical protein